MRKLGTIDFEVLQLAINENGTFDETHLENSNLKNISATNLSDAAKKIVEAIK